MMDKDKAEEKMMMLEADGYVRLKRFEGEYTLMYSEKVDRYIRVYEDGHVWGPY